jgi:hypothetical protein
MVFFSWNYSLSCWGKNLFKINKNFNLNGTEQAFNDGCEL